MNENRKNHKLMWNELARTGGIYKSEVMDRLGLPDAAGFCYACEECETNCDKCPIDWNGGDCASIHSPFEWWDCEKDIDRRKAYAHHIANMEWRAKK
jgi:hypothetical protein